MQKEMIESNPILKLSFDFSLQVVEYCEFYGKSYPDCKSLLTKLEEIQKVLNKILGTAKRKNPHSYLLSWFIF